MPNGASVHSLVASPVSRMSLHLIRTKNQSPCAHHALIRTHWGQPLLDKQHSNSWRLSGSPKHDPELLRWECLLLAECANSRFRSRLKPPS